MILLVYNMEIQTGLNTVVRARILLVWPLQRQMLLSARLNSRLTQILV